MPGRGDAIGVGRGPRRSGATKQPGLMRTSTVTEPTLCCRGASAGGRAYCANCDLLIGLHGLHVVRVDRDDGEGLVVTVESTPEPVGCPACGVCRGTTGRTSNHQSNAALRSGLHDASRVQRERRTPIVATIDETATTASWASEASCS